jgi:hypothetical protein
MDVRGSSQTGPGRTIAAMDQNSLPRLWTARDVALSTSLPVKRVRAAMASGELPTVCVGAWRRAFESDVVAWIHQHRRGLTRDDCRL